MRDRQQGARRSVTSRIRITSLYTPNEKSLSRWLARSYRETVRVLFAVTAATGGKLLTALDSVVVTQMFPSWNLIGASLRQIDRLRSFR